MEIIAEKYNNFGSKIYMTNRNKNKCDIYFPEYNWTAKSVNTSAFNSGSIVCPYEPRTLGVGYLGEGPYQTRTKEMKPGERTIEYNTWATMVRRCHDPKFQERDPSYIGCTIVDDWYNYQNFGYWYTDNYYEIPGEKMQLDKDILVKNNKVYGPDTCIFVPHHINSLFTTRKNRRGELPIGVFYTNKYSTNRYSVRCNTMFGDRKTITVHGFTDPVEAFEAYKELKEQEIKRVADYYNEYIPQQLYDALYNWQVDIND